MAVSGGNQANGRSFLSSEFILRRGGGGCVRSRKPLKYGDFVPERSHVLCFELFLKFAQNSCPGQRKFGQYQPTDPTIIASGFPLHPVS